MRLTSHLGNKAIALLAHNLTQLTNYSFKNFSFFFFFSCETFYQNFVKINNFITFFPYIAAQRMEEFPNIIFFKASVKHSCFPRIIPDIEQHEENYVIIYEKKKKFNFKICRVKNWLELIKKKNMVLLRSNTQIFN